jgi:hypothetical protein
VATTTGAAARRNPQSKMNVPIFWAAIVVAIILAGL